MRTTHAATLRISLESPQAYRVLYTVSDARGGAAIPYIMNGQAQVKAFLSHLGLTTAEIEVIMTRVEASLSYVLDLSHIDRQTAQDILRRFSPLP